MSKLITYRKVFSPRKGENFRDIAYELVNSEDFIKYLKHMTDTPLAITIEPASVKSEKEQMYAYYQKVILSVAIDFFTDQGWERIDKDIADELLKTYTAKDYVINLKTGEKTQYLRPKRRMPKAELSQYINQCIIFLESNGYKVPESADYKITLATGISGWSTTK